MKGGDLLMKKHMVALACMCLALCLFFTPTYGIALKEGNLETSHQVRFTNINVFSVDADVSSNGKASVTAYLNGRDGDKSKIIAYLQQYKSGRWKTIKSWSATDNDMTCSIGKSYYVESGYSYRTKAYGYVYSDGSIVDKSTITSKTVKYD